MKPIVGSRLHGQSARHAGQRDGLSALAEHARAAAFSDENIRLIAEALPEIVWTSMPDGYNDYMNKRWYDYTGLTEYETLTQLKTAVHPEDYALYKARWKESVLTGKPYEMSYRFRRASDGMYRWHIGRALPVYDQRGKIIKWIGTCVDIHAQKEAEERIRILNAELEDTVRQRTQSLQKEIRQRRRAEERYREHLTLLHSMIDLFPMAAVVSDARGTLRQANERFYQLFGIDANAAQSPTLRPFGVVGVIRRRFPRTDIEPMLREIIDCTHAFRRDFTDEDGKTYLFEFIPAAEGDTESGSLLLIRDVSQEKKIETAKSEFMSLASHQLRTPLTSVRWALGKLSRMFQGKMNETEERLLQRARNSAATMAETISTMLSISRIEAGLHAMEKSDVRLQEFLQSIADTFSESLEEQQLSLAVLSDPKVSVHTDAAMLREIIENLLSNAIKYTPPGGSVSLGAEKKSGRVLLSVRDTGFGIPAHQQQNVFTKFFRGENITKVDTQGTGLGLYLVSQLASTLGGSISFTSDEGKGSEFTLELPAR